MGGLIKGLFGGSSSSSNRSVAVAAKKKVKAVQNVSGHTSSHSTPLRGLISVLESRCVSFPSTDRFVKRSTVARNMAVDILGREDSLKRRRHRSRSDMGQHTNIPDPDQP